MVIPKKTKAMLSADSMTVIFKIGTWRGDFPVDDLQEKIGLYEGLRDRQSKLHGGAAYYDQYQPVVEALKKIRDRIKAERA